MKDKQNLNDIKKESGSEPAAASESQNASKKREKSRTAIFAVIVVVLLAIIIALLIRSFTDRGVILDPQTGAEVTDKLPIDIDPSAQEGAIPTKSPEEIQEEINKKVAQGMINISMNTYPVFDNGAAEGNLLIYNDPSNNYAQVIEIYHDDELIYRSGLIPVGSRIENAKLMVELPKGEYPCVAYFNSVDEEGNVLGTAGAQIVINIAN